MSQIWYISVMITLVIFNSAKITFAYDAVPDTKHHIESDSANHPGNILHLLLGENSLEDDDNETEKALHFIFVDEHEQARVYSQREQQAQLFLHFGSFILFESDSSPPLT